MKSQMYVICIPMGSTSSLSCPVVLRVGGGRDRDFISGGAVYHHLESGTQCDHLGIGSCCNPYFPGSMSLLNTMGHISG